MIRLHCLCVLYKTKQEIAVSCDRGTRAQLRAKLLYLQ